MDRQDRRNFPIKFLDDGGNCDDPDDHMETRRGRIIGELFLASYFKASYFGELFLCKLDY